MLSRLPHGPPPLPVLGPREAYVVFDPKPIERVPARLASYAAARLASAQRMAASRAIAASLPRFAFFPFEADPRTRIGSHAKARAGSPMPVRHRRLSRRLQLPDALQGEAARLMRGRKPACVGRPKRPGVWLEQRREPA